MALSAGTVTFNADHTLATHTGLAGELYTRRRDRIHAFRVAQAAKGLNQPGLDPAQPETLDYDTRKLLADMAFDDASAIYVHFTANAQPQIVVSAGGLQRDNTGGSPATLAPSSPQTLTGTLL